jgi:hypothetical protein
MLRAVTCGMGFESVRREDVYQVLRTTAYRCTPIPLTLLIYYLDRRNVLSFPYQQALFN